MIRNAAIAGAVALGAAGVGVGWTIQQNVLADDEVGGTVDTPAGVDLDGDGVISDDERVTPSAIYFDCPGGVALGELHNGDRILTVATHETVEGWLALREPLAPSNTVWISAAQVVPDETVEALPAAPCASGQAVQVTVPDGEVPDETTTTEPEVALPPGETTTTTAGSTPNPTAPPPTATTPNNTTTTASTTTTTAAPKPTVNVLAPAPGTISERYASGGYSCGDPSTSLVRATMANATSATMSWSVNGSTGQKAMTKTGSDLWQVVLGSFDENTIAGGSATISVTIRATGPGGTTTRTTSVTLDDCSFG